VSERNFSFSEAAALTSGLTLFVSVLHEWAYFKVLDFHILGLMSFADFFRIAVGWMPFVLVVWLGIGMLGIIGSVLQDLGEEQQGKITKFFPKTVQWLRAFLIHFFWISVLVLALVNVLFAAQLSYSILCTAGILFWVVVSRRLQTSAFLSEYLGPKGCIVLGVAPILTIMVLSFGAGSAQSDMTNSKGRYILERSVEGVREVNLLRSFELGVVVFEPDTGMVAFVPWAEVATLEKHLERYENATSLMCKWFDVGCKSGL